MPRPKGSKDIKKRKPRVSWKPAEIQLLMQIYGSNTNEHIANSLNKSKDSVKAKARKLGLVKDHAIEYGTVQELDN